jgi:hypothetical protein
MQAPSSLRTDCPTCGTVEVSTNDASLVLDLSDQASGHVLRFFCSRCGSEHFEQVDERATRLLMSAGVGLVGSPLRAPSTSDDPNTHAPR